MAGVAWYVGLQVRLSSCTQINEEAIENSEWGNRDEESINENEDMERG
jgi:hypothetical protein